MPAVSPVNGNDGMVAVTFVQVVVPTLRYCTVYFVAQDGAVQLNVAVVAVILPAARLVGSAQPVYVTTVGSEIQPPVFTV